MSNISSKIEILYMINELKESGDKKNADKLQKIFLESIVEDREIGKFNILIELNRLEKKIITTAKLALSESQLSSKISA